jgi:protein TonB
MPQEFLRDVVRAHDRRRRRHWSVLPLSIAGHAALVAVVLIGPIAAEVEMPQISSPNPPPRFMRTMPAPSPPAPAHAAPTPRAAPAVPLEAPSTIVPERPEVPSNPIEGAIPLGVGVASGPPTLGEIGDGIPPPAPLPPPPPVQPRVARVGYGIREPKKLEHVAPEYPDLARRAGVEGVVVLEAMLDATGRVDKIRVLTSVPLLNEAAIRAVKQWRYSPTQLNGVPVPVLMTITVRFSLER